MVCGSTTRIRNTKTPESNLMVYQNELDNWDRVLVVRYPGRRTFLQLVANPVSLPTGSGEARPHRTVSRLRSGNIQPVAGSPKMIPGGSGFPF